ncbi:DDE-type integrase/transposase/recombinase [Fructobacillus fructosus]|uniref:DDE-type integrase/transposase/recombinase n=1 Tax=Fructobacillus fructosus TaxID=1631 RepID=UPI001658ADB1|nr:DDE-type integrase/transposase/recombinase [Fructobacillus fructosus]MBC9119129.1 transposase family protein [Fructobacillus fructosus]MBD9366326.1 transposase family protein [Leuconostoc mesenteroides]
MAFIKGIKLSIGDDQKYRKPVTEVLYAQRPNLIKQLDDQSSVWSADVTYIRVPSGQYMYFGTVYDPENRKVLAHKLSSIRDGRFVSDILVEALKRHQKPVYLHTDKGSEYTSSVFENLLATNHIRHSYSKKGHPYDNARIEAFHSILKRELIYPKQFKSKFELVTRISRYIHERIHTYESNLVMQKSVQLIDIRAQPKYQSKHLPECQI